MFEAVLEVLGGRGSRLWPLYIAAMVLIAAILFAKRRPEQGFVAWLFPKEIYFSRSHLTDIKLFLFGRVLATFGLFQLVAVTALIANFTVTTFGSFGSGLVLGPVAIAFLVLMTNDFGVYWVHRIHHENKIFWPFHSVHHSAEVMTPITVYRKHPVYDIFSTLLKSLLLGLLQGLVLAGLTNEASLSTILGVNAFYFAFNILGANFRHSHVWLSYGRVLEHIFISPAQHQIHHSIERRHYNKNYGEVLAIWDWMFGTLYVPETEEKIRFGLGDENGDRIDQPHPTLKDALLVPFQDSAKALSQRPSDQPETPQMGQ